MNAEDEALKTLAKRFNQYSDKEVATAVQLGELFPLRG